MNHPNQGSPAEQSPLLWRPNDLVKINDVEHQLSPTHPLLERAYPRLIMGVGVDAEFALGNEEFVKEDWAKALLHFTRASELDPSKAEYVLHKAAALTKMNEFDRAAQACDQAMKLEPQNPKCYLRKGMALVQKGDLAAARAALETGQRMDPSSKSFQTWLKKCGDAPAAPAAAAAPPQIGQHDAQLQSLYSVHGDQVYPMVETMFDFFKRKTDFFDRNGPLAVDMIGDLAKKYAAAAKASGGAPPAAAGDVRESGPGGSLMDMPVVVSSSAKSALEKAIKLREEQGEEQGGGGIKPGTQCKNNSCTQSYQDESSLNQDCQYHPGAPVFHEGYKYWSCCKKKKTTEFSEFLTFTGCTQGKCIFTDDPTKKKKALCRYDFFQQGPNVTVSIYAKKVDPSQCEFKISANRLKLSILFDFINTFSLDLQLAGRVRPEECKVEILGPKVEIVLKKGDGSSWSELGDSLLSEDD